MGLLYIKIRIDLRPESQPSFWWFFNAEWLFSWESENQENVTQRFYVSDMRMRRSWESEKKENVTQRFYVSDMWVMQFTFVYADHHPCNHLLHLRLHASTH